MLFTNELLVQADMATTLNIDLAGDATHVNYNTGIMQAYDGGTLRFHATTLDNTGGIVQALDNSVVTFDSASCIVGGTLTTEDTGYMQVEGGNALYESLLHSGTTIVNNAHDLRLIGTVTNNGTISVESIGSSTDLWADQDGVVLTGTGEVVLNGHAFNRINAGDWSYTLTHGPDHTIRGGGNIGVNNMSFTNQGDIIADSTGTLIIDIATSGTGLINESLLHVTGDGYLVMYPGPFEHYGTVQIDETRSLHRDGDFLQTGGNTIVEGTPEMDHNGVVDLRDGVLMGTGLVDGEVVADSGTVEPGMSVGTLTVEDFSPTHCGYVHFEIGEYTANDDYDVLEVNGVATLNGTISAELINGFVPQIGDSFQVLTGGRVSGFFGNGCHNLPTLPEGHFFVDHGTPGVVSLVVLEDGPREGDLNWDGEVSIDDVFAILGLWGPCGCDCCPGDLTGDGQISIDDIFALLGLWG